MSTINISIITCFEWNITFHVVAYYSTVHQNIPRKRGPFCIIHICREHSRWHYWSIKTTPRSRHMPNSLLPTTKPYTKWLRKKPKQGRQYCVTGWMTAHCYHHIHTTRKQRDIQIRQQWPATSKLSWFWGQALPGTGTELCETQARNACLTHPTASPSLQQPTGLFASWSWRSARGRGAIID